MSSVKCLNPWDPQSKRQYQIDGVYCTLDAGNAGGGQAHGICYAIEGNVVDRVSAKNGKGWCENVSPTLNTQDRHAICYSVDCRNGALSEEVSVTLQAANQSGFNNNCIAPVLIGRPTYSVDCRNLYLNEEKSGTLQAKNIGGFSYNYLNPVLKEKT